MRIDSLALFVSGLIVLGPPPIVGQDVESTTVADSIRVLTNNLAASWERLDPDEYLGWFASDLVFYFEGQRVGRSEFDASVNAAMRALRSSTFEILDPHVQILAKDVATISFRLREVMVDTTGATTDLRGALTLIWSRRADGWKVVLAHESLPPSGEGSPHPRTTDS